MAASPFSRMTLELIIEILFFVITLVAIFLQPAGIPGNFIAVGFLLIHRLIFHEGVSWFFIFGGLLLSLLGEGVESIMGVVGARRYGATKWGMAAAFAGGLMGAVIGTAIFPVAGTILGVFAGGFILTFLVESFLVRQGVEKGFRAGTGTLLGRVISTVFKYSIGFILLFFMAWGFWL